MRKVVLFVSAIFFSVLMAFSFGLFFFGGARKIADYLKLFSDTDWSSFFLSAFLALYFLAAISVWWETFFNWQVLRRERPTWGLLIRGVFRPVSLVCLTLWGIIYGFLDWALFRFLHQDLRIIIDRAIAVLGIIGFSIFSILLFANLWQPQERGCKWIFPKILTCLIAEFPDFAGGLVGAGGTIFAGWLAWLATQQQINQPAVNSVALHSDGRQRVKSTAVRSRQDIVLPGLTRGGVFFVGALSSVIGFFALLEGIGWILSILL
jgi:hypothetical protein